MSGGTVCKCEESKKPIAERAWFVTQRNCNHSSFNRTRFNGSQRMSSDWSAIVCDGCHHTWRTKAQYVASLRDRS